MAYLLCCKFHEGGGHTSFDHHSTQALAWSSARSKYSVNVCWVNGHMNGKTQRKDKFQSWLMTRMLHATESIYISFQDSYSKRAVYTAEVTSGFPCSNEIAIFNVK